MDFRFPRSRRKMQIYIHSQLRAKRRVSNSCNRGDLIFCIHKDFTLSKTHYNGRTLVVIQRAQTINKQYHKTWQYCCCAATVVIVTVALLRLPISSLLLLYIVHQFLLLLSELSVQFYLLSLQRRFEGSNPGWHPLGHVPFTLSHTSPCEQFPHVDMQPKP